MSGARERMERVNRAKRAMEAALEFMCPGQTGPEVAARLLRRYGSPGALIEAGKHQLMRQGLSENNALLLSMIPDIVRHMEQQHFGPHPRLATLNAAEKYLRVCYIGMNVERFFLLALDKSGKLIECVHMQTGNEDSAPFYLKNILAEIVRTDAKAIVIAHNHPNLTPMPSVADVECTTALIYALNSIGAPLLDHVIMVGRHALSLRGFGYVPEARWRQQAPENGLLQHWLADWDEAGSLREMEKLAKK